MTASPSTAPRKSAQAIQSPAARQAGRPSAGRMETASHSHWRSNGDSRRVFRLLPPDTSKVNRSFPNPFGGKPLACGHVACPPARMGWGGKSGIVALARASGQSPPHGAALCALGTKGYSPLCSHSIREWENGGDESPSDAMRQRHPCTAPRQGDKLRIWVPKLLDAHPSEDRRARPFYWASHIDRSRMSSEQIFI